MYDVLKQPARNDGVHQIVQGTQVSTKDVLRKAHLIELHVSHDS